MTQTPVSLICTVSAARRLGISLQDAIVLNSQELLKPKVAQEIIRSISAYYTAAREEKFLRRTVDLCCLPENQRYQEVVNQIPRLGAVLKDLLVRYRTSYDWE